MTVIDFASYRRPATGTRISITQAGTDVPTLPVPSANPSSLRARRARRTAWWKAEGVLELYKALRHLHVAATSHRVAGNELAKSIAKQNGFQSYDDVEAGGTQEWALLDATLEAEANLICTPAPTLAEIAWKRRQLPDIWCNQFITLEEAQRAIERDEAWHAANPTRRSRAGKAAQ